MAESMIVRITGNIDDLKKSMADGRAVIEGTTVKIREMAKPTDTLHQSFSKFDSVLSSVGINLGTEVKALGELTQASGQTASSLGTFTTAGLAAGAAMAGWQIGRKVSEFFDLDDAVGRVAAKLFGFGDVAAQEAAAGAEALARASKIAGTEITNMELAIAINEGAVKTQMAAVAAAAKVTIDAAAAQAEADRRITESNKEKMAALKEAAEESRRMSVATAHLAIAQGDALSVLNRFDAQLVETVKHYHELGMTTEDIATLTGTVPAQIDLVTDALDAQVSLVDEMAAKWRELEVAQREANQSMVNEAQIAAEKQKQIFKAAVDAIIENQRRITGGGERTYDLSTKAGMDEFIRLNPGATITGAATDPDYFKTHTLQDAIRDGLINLYGKYGSSRRFAGGVENDSGGLALVGERGPELVNLPRGSDVIPNHQIGAMAGTTVHLTVNGDVYGPGGITALTRQMEAQLVRSFGASGVRIAAGA